jgi:hypothetical protein
MTSAVHSESALSIGTSMPGKKGSWSMARRVANQKPGTFQTHSTKTTLVTKIGMYAHTRDVTPG